LKEVCRTDHDVGYELQVRCQSRFDNEAAHTAVPPLPTGRRGVRIRTQSPDSPPAARLEWPAIPATQGR
jgi:hypothetical protein